MRLIRSALGIISVITLLACLTPVVSAAQDGQQGLTEMEMKEYAQKQFEQMFKRAMESASTRLKAGEPIKAFSVVADRQGGIRLVRLDEAEKMKPDIALEIMRRSLRAMVKNGKIGATCLVYVARNPNEDSEAKQVLVAEMEHVFGPTLAELTPFAKEGDKMVFGAPVTIKSKRSIFKLPEDDGGEASSDKAGG